MSYNLQLDRQGERKQTPNVFLKETETPLFFWLGRKSVMGYGRDSLDIFFSGA